MSLSAVKPWVGVVGVTAFIGLAPVVVDFVADAVPSWLFLSALCALMLAGAVKVVTWR